MSSHSLPKGAPTRKLAGIVAIGLLGLVACAPKPPPPPSVCGAVPADTNYGAFVTNDQTGKPDVVEFKANNKSEVDQQVKEIDKANKVHAVEAAQPVSALAVNPNDQHYGLQWGFQPDEADFPGAWNHATEPNGAAVRVAVVDTGVQAGLQDLVGRVLQGRDFVIDNQSASNFGRKDGDGHGTHVAGTIAANDNTVGVLGGAPLAWIVPVRVLDCNGNGTTKDVADGIIWAADPAGGNADVISLSLGGGPSMLEEQAIEYALSQGVTVVAAAGNNGPGGAINYPAAYPGVIAVGAKDEGAGAVHLTGGNVSTPGTTANALTGGTLEYFTRVQPDSWTPASSEVLASKLEDGVSGYEPLALNPDGTLSFRTETASVTSPSLGAAGRQWLRVVRESGTVAFSTAPDSATPPASWTLVPDAVDLGAGGTVSTPASAQNALTGASTVELIMRVRADSWRPSAAPQVLASKYDAATNSGYELSLGTDGKLTFTAGKTAVASVTATSLSAVPSTSTARQWLRVTRTISGPNSIITFQRATDRTTVPTSWSNLGQVTVSNWSEQFVPNPLPLVLGNRPIAAQGFTGSVLYAAVRPTVASGAWAALMDAVTPAAGAASWTGGAGETWTVNAPAAVRKGSTPSAGGFVDNPAVAFTIGARPDGSQPFHGFAFYSELRASTGGAPVLIMDSTTPDLPDTSWTSATTEIWTVQGDAEVTGRNAAYSNTNGYVAVIAPGTNVISTLSNGSYGNMSGTSMATPHVSALVALILQKCWLDVSSTPHIAQPQDAPQQVRAWITSTASGPFAGFPATNDYSEPVGLLKAGAAYAAACP